MDSFNKIVIFFSFTLKEIYIYIYKNKIKINIKTKNILNISIIISNFLL